MAVLTSTGIDFSNTSLNSKYDIIQQSSGMLFLEASAPEGWVQVTTHNDKTLRVVDGTGAGSGGSFSFSGKFNAENSITGPVTVTSYGLAVGDTTLSAPQIPAHSHTVNATGSSAFTGDQGPQASQTSLLSSGPTDGGGFMLFGYSHAHPVSFTSASGPASATFTFNVFYVNMIICTLS